MDGHADILRERGGGSHVMLERRNLAGSSGGTKNSHKKMSALRCEFWLIYSDFSVKKIIKKIIL